MLGEGIDTTTPTGKAMFQMCGVFAEFERSIIPVRIGAGLARAKANGKRLGRPRVDAPIEEAIRNDPRRGDKGIQKIALKLGVGASAVQRVADAEKMGRILSRRVE
jgi:DNA invertase Pin-like site-specific DNA recombinase